MLLKKTISSTKKFFKNSIQSFKSLLSGGYEKLPKATPFNPLSCSVGDSKARQSFRELDNFYLDFTNQWDFNEKKVRKRNKKQDKVEVIMNDHEEVYKGSFMNSVNQSPLEGGDSNKDMQSSHQESERNSSNVVKEEGNLLVMQRLKELQKMDLNDVNTVLDIDEVLHYYSRLTSPAYLQIVDRFFMQVYSEFFINSSTTIHKDY
ncbi:hypothetical protein FRX31_019450 [Thalictrum thalictroides]|uniref:OVATE domain-containing protein n=1 Tax=Thalictrum thalictroides TaxID=46969 RepID=A0A7J6W355_THATH|nr:hypothetical protein FRX31_019450 [Thalictrum thalictroides]